MTATPEALTVGRLARQRRRVSWSRGWRLFRRNRSGMVGLVVLGIFVLVALCAPLLADPEGLGIELAALLVFAAWALVGTVAVAVLVLAVVPVAAFGLRVTAPGAPAADRPTEERRRPPGSHG